MEREKAKEPRTEQLNLSLTTSELAEFRERAAALGMRPSHFGRTLLFAGGKKASNPEQGNNSRNIHRQLMRIGNYLNQLLRQQREAGGSVPLDADPLLRDIRALIARIPS
jgi:hypothetical protein